jgi:hypothetical protein
MDAEINFRWIIITNNGRISNISKLAYVYRTKIALCLNRNSRIEKIEFDLIDIQWINNFI